MLRCLGQTTNLARQLINCLEISYCAAVAVAKLGLLLQYMRIFVTPVRRLIYGAIQFLIWSNLLVYTGAILWLIFGCNPREKIWNPSIPGHCFILEAKPVFSATWNLVSDFSILALPLFSIWKLQMPIKRKAGVSAIFAVGIMYDLTLV